MKGPTFRTVAASIFQLQSLEIAGILRKNCFLFYFEGVRSGSATRDRRALPTRDPSKIRICVRRPEQRLQEVFRAEIRIPEIDTVLAMHLDEMPDVIERPLP